MGVYWLMEGEEYYPQGGVDDFVAQAEHPGDAAAVEWGRSHPAKDADWRQVVAVESDGPRIVERLHRWDGNSPWQNPDEYAARFRAALR
jgi:hypothetical protein